MESMFWKKYDNGTTVTRSGEILWICPICNRGLHVCAEGDSDKRDKCPDCGVALIYPWEKK